jgi:alpha-glucosidase (family GH31 glycosyl hydrolase)
VQWNDIDYMSENKDFTIDDDKFAGLGSFVEDLHKVRHRLHTKSYPRGEVNTWG